MNPEQKVEFLKLVGAGHSPETAALEIGLDISLVEGQGLNEDIRQACLLTAGRLRAKPMQVALDSDDVRVLSSLLDRLEAVAGTENR